MVVGRIGGGIQKKRWGPGTHLYHHYLLEVGNIVKILLVPPLMSIRLTPNSFLTLLTLASPSCISLLSSPMMDPPLS